MAILGVVIVGGIAYAGLTFWQKGLLGSVPFLSKPTPTPTLVPEPTPTPDPTAGWKTYTSQKMNFAIEYPADWFSHAEEEYPASKTWQVVFSFPIDNPSTQDFKEGQKAGIHISYWSKPDETLQEYADKLAGQAFQDLGKEPERSEATVAGERALVIDDYQAGLGNRIVVFDSGSGRYFAVLAVDKNETYSSYKNTFDLMLSTIKFLPPASPSPSRSPAQGTPIKIKSISLTSPTKGPLVIKGTVDSGWMFEGVMPVKLLDAGRQEIASGSAKETAPGSWQSGKAVDFSVSLTFTTESASGFLVFQNDNPSGLPSNQKSFELPVRFRQ